MRQVYISMFLDAPTTAMNDADRLHLWQWITYAFLRGQAYHAIDEFIVGEALTQEAVDGIRAILSARNPLALLYGGDPSVEPSGQVRAREFSWETQLRGRRMQWCGPV